MSKRLGIIVCLLISLQLSAISYEPMTYSAPPTAFRSTSAYSGSIQPTGFAAISASNYEALNSEGGACYNAASGPRKGRPKGGDSGNGGGFIGDYEFHSPIGDVPFVLMAILASLYAFFAKKRKKMQKNLVN